MCQRGVDLVGDIQAAERSDAVNAVRITQFLVIRELQVGPVLDMLGDVIQVRTRIEALELLAILPDQADVTVIQFQAVFGGDHAKVAGGEDAQTYRYPPGG